MPQLHSSRAARWGAVFSAAVILCLPHATEAEDHHHAEFRCGKTFVTFQGLRLDGTIGQMMTHYTVRKAHILKVERVLPEGMQIVEMQQPGKPEPHYLVLTQSGDWSRLVECLD